MSDGDEQFVGYHGTSSHWVRAILHEVRPLAGRNYTGRSQLGVGFYVAEDRPTALEFAENAVVRSGGSPVVLRVYARDFSQLRGMEVPTRLWWAIPDDSPYVTDFDYLTAPITGYEPVRQIKFNPRAYGAASVR